MICAKFEVICSLFYKSMKLGTIQKWSHRTKHLLIAIATILLSAITKLCILCHISWTKHNTEYVMSTRMFLCSSITMLPYTDSNAIMITYLLTSLHLFCCTPVSWPLLLSLHLVSCTWLRPGFVQKTPQPLLFSLTASFSGLLISNTWKHSTHSSLCNTKYFEFYAIMVSVKMCSCGSVVEHCVSSAKVVGSIPREHMY